MTIVASNSLTVSNVNDGTITHLAYSWSADGQDRFMTVYPGRNLIVQSDLKLWPLNRDNGDVDFWSQDYFHSDNYIATNGETVFTFSSPDYAFKGSGNHTLAMYDSDKKYLGWQRITSPTQTLSKSNVAYIRFSMNFTDEGGTLNNLSDWLDKHRYKLETGTLVTPYTPSPLDDPEGAYPQFIGTYTDYIADDSTEPSKYTWAKMRGEQGERGKQIFKSSYEDIPNGTGYWWSDLSPAPSVDNSPKIGDTIITPAGNIFQINAVVVGGGGGGGTFGVGDVLGNIKGPSGSNGDPGKVVSDIEPSTRFKGLTWKYIGTSDLTASDGTVIHPNTEYYYNGTHWMINYFSVNNFESESITSDKINGKNLTITDGEFISKTSNGPVTTSTEIKDNHIAISKTDGTVNTKNDLAVDTEQGFAMKFTNNTTGLTREASVNFQGVSTSDSNGNYAQLTPQGTKLSTDVPWTDITRASGVGTSGTLRARINNGVFYAQSKDVTIPSIAPNSLITIGTMSSKFSGVSGFDTLGLLYSPGQLSVASVTVGNDGKINIGNPNPTTMSGKVIQFSINIPLG